MSAVSEPTGDRELCGKWMPRKQAKCARGSGHPPPCSSPDAMEKQRQRSTERRPNRVVTPEDRARWRKAYKFNRLGITEEQFQAMLEAQGYACAICREPFGERNICADHDHNCCPPQPDLLAKTCGQCIRGLLCVRCNTRIEWVQQYGDAIAAYLNQVDRRGLEPLTPAV